MAKRRYRRHRRKYGRWAPNIVKVSSQYTPTLGEFYNVETLAVNPTQSTTGVSQAFTVKNFEITFTIEPFDITTYQDLESMTAYIMYVPQGMNVTSSYYAEHPEYILAYKFLGSPAGTLPIYVGTQGIANQYEAQQFQPTRIKSRLSRKLQTGDSIILYIQGSNTASNSANRYKIDGIVRWWSKAN